MEPHPNVVRESSQHFWLGSGAPANLFIPILRSGLYPGLLVWDDAIFGG